MGRYLQLLDRATQERSCDKSDKSDKRSPIDNGTLPFGRICRFCRNPESQVSCIDAEEERGAIVEYDDGVPHAWAEGFARLDPNKPPGDIPPRRWLRFIDDCGRFLDAGWAKRTALLGWKPLDLFGADRERPFARVDRLGLLWLIDGRKLVAFTEETAIVESVTGVRQTYYRRPVEVGRLALAWELA